ncbi:hypothetical protein [Clostridium septicum]|uniref:Uncharacterized protein n=1 Tax=Clostridium septicum TaxID=1504 RepID=A0A9N7JKQ7_CLOSE|nr:hypothetical protein [Clostridium septicum]AYE34188.1 hypothetical protein CP523_06745 [Clostridium septicum]MDU1315287.1 hypothetical protein [Clostridium septicum]QAS59552.1 hypothetical protein EI377_01220 [Clostridium septicum]UEC21183.1 hypothetical protein LK444_02035 [Clostridium septicum]USS00770.1 hypothetical protein NH397_15060 [Clostridium septicum]
MIRTMVCQKEGCSGNRFRIQADDGKIQLTCDQCKSKYYIETSSDDVIMLPNCSKCNNETFKIFRDVNKKAVYAKCTECGSEPEMMYIDSDGTQVSYEAKLLNDIKEVMSLVEQRMCNLERNVQDLEQGQDMLEQSLAYINRYIVERD